MPDIFAQNGREALCKVADQVLRHGALVEPRGSVTRELEHLTIEIQNPADALCTGINAAQSTEVAAAEALQLIGGFSDPAFAVEHAPALRSFLNDRGEFDGAYGPRLRAQYRDLLKRLGQDKDTRQAVLSIWDSTDLRMDGSKDYPCTLVLGFAVRRDALNLSVVMRSNDVNWGFKNDIFQFTQLQATIASLLGIPLGLYRHTAFSMHLYERDWNWAEDLFTDGAAEPIGDHPYGVSGEHLDDVLQTARHIARKPFTYFPEASHRWYAAALKGGDAQ